MTNQTDNAMGRPLKIGAFYWVIPALDPDTDDEWERAEQPARYAGDGKWNCPAVDGASDWPMRWVGSEILPPSDDLKAKAVKSDADTLWLARMIEQGAEPGSFYAQAAQRMRELAQAAQGAGEVAAAVREALEFYADGGHEVELHGKIPWVAERDRLHDRGFHPVCEAYNGSETFVEGGQKAQAALALLDTQPAAGADVLDAKRWRYAIADGGNQSMNFMDIYDDWDGDGSFVEAFDKAMASDAAIAASGRQE